MQGDAQAEALSPGGEAHSGDATAEDQQRTQDADADAAGNLGEGGEAAAEGHADAASAEGGGVVGGEGEEPPPEDGHAGADAGGVQADVPEVPAAEEAALEDSQ